MPSSRATSLRKPARRYHHGDLKAALVAAAIDILRRKGPGGLTLRAVAAATGVTATATYRHFADRRALVAAVATEGFQRLQASLELAMRGPGGREGLKGVAMAYVRFGLDHPDEYRMMFGSEIADASGLPDVRAAGRQVLEFVAQGIAQLQEKGLVGSGDARLMAATTWAALHGLVMLALDGQSRGVAATTDVMVDEMANLLMFGMAPRHRDT